MNSSKPISEEFIARRFLVYFPSLLALGCEGEGEGEGESILSTIPSPNRTLEGYDMSWTFFRHSYFTALAQLAQQDYRIEYIYNWRPLYRHLTDSVLSMHC